ncbi:MAG: translocation/assembly module TamB domain-containing protein [Deltaproteobacteria bacterium]|nr:translocation/assembly module TamB domain-containing protein [Deltaproteobacteria bacterium]
MGVWAARLLTGLLSLLLALLLLTPVAAWWLAQNPDVRAWLLAQAQAEVRTSLGSELTVAGLEGNLLTGFTLLEPRLTSPQGTWFAARRVSADYNLISLIGGVLNLRTVRAEAPHLVLPLPDFPDDQSAPPALALLIPKLVIEDGSLEGGGELGPVLRGQDLAITGRFSLTVTGGPNLHAEMKGGKAWLTDWSQPVEVRGAVSYLNERLTVHQADLAVAGQKLTGKLRWDLQRDPSRLSLEVQGQGLEPHRLPWGVARQLPAGAPLELVASLTGPLDDLDLQAQLRRAGGELDLQTRLGPEPGAYHVKASFRGLDLAAWGLSPRSFRLTGRLDLTGQGLPTSPAATAQLSAELASLATPGLEAGGVTCEAALAEGVVTVGNLAGRGPWGSLEGSGALEVADWAAPRPLAAQVKFQDLSAPPLLAAWLPAVLGQAKLSGQGELTPAQGQGPARVTLNLGPSLLAPGISLDTLTAQGELQDWAWRLTNLEVVSELAHLTATGSLDPRQVDLAYNLDLPDARRLLDALEKLNLLPPSVFSGGLTAEGRLWGPWDRLSLAGKAQGSQVITRFADMQSMRLEANLSPIWPHPRGRVRLESTAWHSGEVFFDTLEAEVISRDTGRTLKLAAHGPDLGGGLTFTSPGPLALPLEGQVSGLFLTPAGLATWRQSGRAGLILGRDKIVVSGLVLTQKEQRVAADLNFSPTGQVTAEVQGHDLDLNLLLAYFPLPRRGGRLDLQAHLSGTLDAPLIKAQGRVTRLDLGPLGHGEVDFAGDFAAELLRLEGAILVAGQPVLQAKSELGLTISLRPPVWEPTAQGFSGRAWASRLPVSYLEPLFPGVGGVRGVVTGDFTWDGTLERPNLEGGLTLEGGALTILANNQAVGPIDAQIKVHNGRITVEKLTAKSGGLVTVAGVLDLPWRDQGRLDLTVTARQVVVSLGTLGQVTTDADFKLAGSPAEPRLTGAIVPLSVFIQVDFSATPGHADVIIMKPGEEPPPWGGQAPAAELPRFLQAAAVDVHLDLQKGLRVEGHDGWLLLTGGVHAVKEPDQPLLYYDKVILSRGVVIVRGRRFVAQQGFADFAGQPGPNPLLSAQAVLNQGGTKVLVNISGTARKPQVQLASEPPMSQADILSTIIFGQPVASLNQGQSSELSLQALALLGQEGREEMERIFGPDLAPDVVTVHDNPTSGSSLEAGKYLGPDLYLRYRQSVGRDPGQSVGLEYRLGPYISLESQVGSTRDSGIDVIFNYDFQ